MDPHRHAIVKHFAGMRAVAVRMCSGAHQVWKYHEQWDIHVFDSYNDLGAKLSVSPSPLSLFETSHHVCNPLFTRQALHKEERRLKHHIHALQDMRDHDVIGCLTINAHDIRSTLLPKIEGRIQELRKVLLITFTDSSPNHQLTTPIWF